MAMTKTIKVTCSGADQHLNEIELAKIVQPTPVTRGTTKPKEIPARSVFPCQFCKAGKVVVTREMVEDATKKK